MVCDSILGKGNPFETDDSIVPRPVEWGLSEEEADELDAVVSRLQISMFATDNIWFTKSVVIVVKKTFAKHVSHVNKNTPNLLH